MFKQFHKNVARCKTDGMAWFIPKMPEALRDILPEDIEFKSYRKNEIIVSEDDYPDKAVLIKSGCLYCTIVNSYVEKEQLTCMLAVDGSLISSTMQLSDCAQHMRIQPVVKSEAAVIPFHTIDKALQKDAKLYKAFVNYASICDKTKIETLKLSARYEYLAESGVKSMVLLALSDQGSPSYDAGIAKRLASMGVPCFACTPKMLPEMIEGAVKGRNLFELAKTLTSKKTEVKLNLIIYGIKTSPVSYNSG